MPKISVIVPVYNVEKYLRECMDSIIKQTFKDMEIICIDDGSTDNSGKILDEYADSDSRIKVIHKINEGYGKAMNIGMKSATGEYIGVVDSDDYILPEMYEVLYNEAKKNDLDFIRADYYEFREKKEYLCHASNLENYYNIVLTSENRDAMIRFKMLFWPNWAGIYKRSFLEDNDITHNDAPGASYQDTGFSMQYVLMAERAEFIDKIFYMHRIDNPNSSTSPQAAKSKEKMMAMCDEHNFVERKLMEKNLIQECKINNLVRFYSYRWKFHRIDDSLKLIYADIVKNDYVRLKGNIASSDFLNADDSSVLPIVLHIMKEAFEISIQMVLPNGMNITDLGGNKG